MTPIFLLLALASTQPDKHPTDVKTRTEDAATTKLADSIRAALPQASRLRPEGGEDDPDLALAIVSAEANGKNTAYVVDLLKSQGVSAPQRLASFSGSCRDDRLASCAADLVAKADRKVKD